MLKEFIAKCRRGCWIDDLDGIAPTGATALVIRKEINVIGPILRHAIHGDDPTWTAIKYADGKVTLHDDGTALVPTDAVDTVTVKKPARGCPEPEPAKRRASEVLVAFCTPAQQTSWERKGFLTCIGNRSGQRYTVFHPNEARRRGHAHLLVNAAGKEVCVWDARVPVEEEVLGIKLAVEHRERWLLEGTLLEGRA